MHLCKAFGAIIIVFLVLEMYKDNINGFIDTLNNMFDE